MGVVVNIPFGGRAALVRPPLQVTVAKRGGCVPAASRTLILQSKTRMDKSTKGGDERRESRLVEVRQREPEGGERAVRRGRLLLRLLQSEEKVTDEEGRDPVV